MGVSKAWGIDDEVAKEFEKIREDKERRSRLLNEAFGIDAKRVKSFNENDRGEDRS